MMGSLCTLSHFILPAVLWGKSFYLLLTDEKTTVSWRNRTDLTQIGSGRNSLSKASWLLRLFFLLHHSASFSQFVFIFFSFGSASNFVCPFTSKCLVLLCPNFFFFFLAVSLSRSTRLLSWALYFVNCLLYIPPIPQHFKVVFSTLLLSASGQ